MKTSLALFVDPRISQGMLHCTAWKHALNIQVIHMRVAGEPDDVISSAIVASVMAWPG
jgi:hypothetical protein